MRPAEDVARVRELASYGLNHSQIARLTGVSRTTVRDWLQATAKRVGKPACETCGHLPHDFERTAWRGIQLSARHLPRRRNDSNAWPCLFPQHGPGRKHERKIELAPWQEAIVDREPEQFIRGWGSNTPSAEAADARSRSPVRSASRASIPSSGPSP